MKAYEYRLRPNKIQEQALMSVLISSRHAYNEALQEMIDYYQTTGKYLHIYEQDKSHGKDRHPDMPAVVVDQMLKRLHRSFTNFFRGRKEGRQVGFPRFKGATRWDSIEFRDALNPLRGSYFSAPKQCGGKIRTIVHRPMEGTFKHARIIKRPSGWYLQCICETEAKPLPVSDQSVGIDVGVNAITGDSDGKITKNPRHLKQSLAHLAKLQRHMAKAQKGSHRRAKARRQVARVYEHITNQRKDTLHKLSRRYVNQYQTIVVEDLNIQGMVRNHHLAQAITDSSWGMLRNMLSYKAEEAGRQFVAVSARYTSQQCSCCGHIVTKALSVRTHLCPFCGYQDDRDVNAAKNILAAGLARTEPSQSIGEGPAYVGESPDALKREAAGL